MKARFSIFALASLTAAAVLAADAPRPVAIRGARIDRKAHV